jgi:hypothetical protein
LPSRTRHQRRTRVPKRKRPADTEYYMAYRTEHVAQGDIFEDLPFVMALPEPPPPDQPVGTGARRVLEMPFFAHGWGMLVSHSSSFMAQPVGTRGYAHAARVVAPIVPFALLDEQNVLNDDHRRLLRKEDKLLHYMYLPPSPDFFEDEHAVVLYRPALVHMDILEGRRRSQLREPAVRQLQAKLVEVWTGSWTDPAQLKPPTMADHWNPPDQPEHLEG